MSTKPREVPCEMLHGVTRIDTRMYEVTWYNTDGRMYEVTWCNTDARMYEVTWCNTDARMYEMLHCVTQMQECMKCYIV